MNENQTYTYDNLGQLLSDTLGGAADQSFTLDPIGNITSVTTDGTLQPRASNSQNELTGIGNSTIVYDNDGNTTTDDLGHP